MGRPSTSGGRLAAIDMLRGIAVSAVLLTHLRFSWATTGPESLHTTTPAWFDGIAFYGRYGVHLFLVLSGFCIHMQWSRTADLTRGVAFGSFWARRLRRLYPPYFGALVLTLAGLLLVYRVLGHAQGIAAWFGYTSTTQLGIDLFLLVILAQNINGASARVGNNPFWSLALEEQLYALYFPLLWLRRTRGWTFVLVLTAVTDLGWRALSPVSHNDMWLDIGPARWLEWTLGALAVEAHHGHVTLPRWASHPATFVALLAAAVANVPPPGGWPSLPIAYLWDDALFGLAFFVLVNWVCRLDREGKLAPRLVVDWIRRLGLVSYSVYLVHMPILTMVRRLAVMLGVHSVPLVLAARFVLAIGGGVVFYWIVERRFLHASRPAAPAVTTPAFDPPPPA